MGPALPNVAIVTVDESDRVLPADADGEVCIAGPNIMPGYYKLPEQTRAVFVALDAPAGHPGSPPGRRRFFRTGDIGHLDADGYLFITGRKKEMLIIAGENVFPREIEEVLNHHPSVRDSAVIGKMDGLRGQVPVAFVELRYGQAFDETALRSWCRDALAGYKIPREIVRVDALPRNPTGRILRRQLRAD